MFQKATKKKLKARIALDGPPGSGKSFTALRFAFTLAGKGGRVAVIDTEHRSASKYQGESPDGVPFDFDVCELEHYAPSTYTNVIREAGKQGYDVLIIDSLSHGWDGLGGALDIVDRKASNSKGGSFAAWREVTPLHREMVETILACPCHVIVTMRSKMGYEVEEVEKNGKKKMQVAKIGMKPIQREGVEYEFDVVGDMDQEHMLVISKSRCSALDGVRAVKPGGSFIVPLLDWLGSGVDAPPSIEQPAATANTSATEQPTKKIGVKLDGNDKGDAYEGDANTPCGEAFSVQIKQAAVTAEISAAKLIEVVHSNGVKTLAELPTATAERLLARLVARGQTKTIPF